MPIRKETSARLVKQKIPYEIFSRDVIQSIENPIALAYYTYLLTKPENWIVRRKELMSHFGIGRKNHDKAMQYLKEIGCVWIMSVQDDKGKIRERLIMVEAMPSQPKVSLSTSRLNPQVGKRDHLEIQRLPKDTEILGKSVKSVQKSTRKRSLEEDLTDTSWAE